MAKSKVLSLCVLALSMVFSSVGYAAPSEKKQVESVIGVDLATNQIKVNLKNKAQEIKSIVEQNGVNVAVDANKTEATITGLEPSTVYSYQVKVEDRKSKETETIHLFAKTKNTEASTGPSISYYTVSPKSFEFFWNGPADTNYTITKNDAVVATVQGNSFKDDIQGAGDTSYAVDFIAPNEKGEQEQYRWYVSIDPKVLFSSNASDGTVTAAATSYVPWSKIRVMGFIKESRVWSPDDNPFDNYTEYFHGDGRGFGYSYGDDNTSTPKYRFVQDVFVDFTNNTSNYRERVGQSLRYFINNDTGLRDYSKDKTGYASMDNMSAGSFTWGTNKVTFRVLTSVGNPLASSPNADADLTFTVHRGIYGACGITEIKGSHDGYPTYEIYRNEGSNGTWTLYTFNQQTLGSLAPPMEHDINAIR